MSSPFLLKGVKLFIQEAILVRGILIRFFFYIEKMHFGSYDNVLNLIEKWYTKKKV